MISSGAGFPKFPAKGSVLQARKERVQLSQRGALGGFQLFHGSDAAGEFVLEVDGGKWHFKIAKNRKVYVLLGRFRSVLFRCLL